MKTYSIELSTKTPLIKRRLRTMKISSPKFIVFTMALFASWVVATAQAQTTVTPEEARAIAKEAYV